MNHRHSKPNKKKSENLDCAITNQHNNNSLKCNQNRGCTHTLFSGSFHLLFSFHRHDKIIDNRHLHSNRLTITHTHSIPSAAYFNRRIFGAKRTRRTRVEKKGMHRSIQQRVRLLLLLLLLRQMIKIKQIQLALVIEKKRVREGEKK